MRRRDWILSVSTVCTMSLAACGDSGDSTNNQNENNKESSDFACGEFETCTSGQFCLRETFPSGEVNAENCVELPSSCGGCDCAQQAAVDSFDGANNCDGFKSCSQSNAAITVTCTNPGVGF